MNFGWTRGLLITAVAVVLSLGQTSAAQEPQVELLWPDGAPGAVGTADADRPTLSLYRAPAGLSNSSAVVICPGGGYGHLAVDHEGKQVAQWLNSLGVTALVLRYRIAPRYHHPAPMTDALRAIRTTRARAAEWRIDPRKIGIIGFSAGGHLASTVGTHFDSGNPDADDPTERISSRPDCMILVYPVITMGSEFTHKGSQNNLLGAEPEALLVESLSNDKQVTSSTPPTFLVHTGEDRAVPAENSALFYLALRRNGVPAELHIFEAGPHGFGLAANDPELSTWTKLCAAWLARRGFLKRS